MGYNSTLFVENQHPPAERPKCETTRVSEKTRTLRLTRVPIVPKDQQVDTRPLSDLGAATHGGVVIGFSCGNGWFASMSNLGRQLRNKVG